MPEKDSQSNSQEQQREEQFSQEQYDLLKHCSDTKDMTDWNKWRGAHPDEQILLKGATLENANLRFANLKHADLGGAHLENASLDGAHLENAHLVDAHLENASLGGAHLENADLYGAHLENAFLGFANLKNADLREAELQGINLSKGQLQDTDFSRAIVDGRTLIWDCEVNRKTKFDGVGLGNIRISPQEKQLLEYNIRRMNWEKWYKGKVGRTWKIWIREVVTGPVRIFWWVSDYGRSTGRIALTFFGFAALFALVYYFIPGLVVDLHVTGHSVLDFIRACYFSIVTMTTLGFGDMYANRESWAGHILLMLQMLLGYVLLAALVTRFAALFTAGGPAGLFEEKELKDEQKQ